ncbi:hypothetical protein H8D51_00410, partial [bacterium]|nr:hypothetical protein [bacterium]
IPGDILRRGTTNLLALNVHNQLDYKRTLPVLGGIRQPRNETGIPRSIDLVKKSQVHISTVRLNHNPEGEGGFTLRAVVTLRNAATAAGLAPQEEYGLTLNAFGYGSVDNKVLLHPQSTKTVQLQLQLKDPPLWSYTEPHLFPVEIILSRKGLQLDREEISYGVRDLKINASELLLNDERFQIRGLVYHFDGVRGQLLDGKQLLADVELIKNLGCNTILMQGGPAPRELLDLCDQNGLFLIDNLPVEQPTAGLLASESYLQAASAYLQALLERDSNHPALLAINLLTDAVMGEESTDQFLTELLSLLPDNGPLSSGHFAAVIGTPAVLPSILFVDEQLLTLVPHNLPVGGPLVASGIGLLAESENLDGFANPWSEIHQAQQLDLLLKRYASASDYAGLLLHSFADWHGAHPLLWRAHPLDLSLHTDGLYSLSRQEKIAARVVHSHFTGTALPPMTRGDYSERVPIWPALVPLLLLLLLVIAMKHNNILALNIKRSLVHVEGFYLDIKSRRSQQLGQGAFIALVNSLMLASLLAVTFHFFRKTILFDEILTLLIPHAGIKALFIHLGWRPLLMQIYAGLLFFLLQWLIGSSFYLLGLVFGSATSLRQMLQYFFWSATPMLFLLPVALIYGHLLTFPGGTTILILLFSLFSLWYLVRLTRIAHFAYPANLGKALLVILGLFLLILLLLFLYYETGMSFTDRLLYLLTVY